MSLVWIKQFSNESNQTITLKQNDPNWHPVLHRGHRVSLPQSGHPDFSDFQRDFQVNQDQPIIVQPGGHFTCDYFVIPWTDSGRLLFEGGQNNGTLEISVGPFGQDNKDYIHFIAKNGAPPVNDIPAGERGVHVAVEATVRLSDQTGFLIDCRNTDYAELAKQLVEIARYLWDLFNGRRPSVTPKL